MVEVDLSTSFLINNKQVKAWVAGKTHLEIYLNASQEITESQLVTF